MEKFRTYKQAKELSSKLNEYILIIEEYEINTKKEWIIHNYAVTNSIARVIRNSRNSEYEISRNDILEVLKDKPIDKLHKIISRGYKRKTRRKSV